MRTRFLSSTSRVLFAESERKASSLLNECSTSSYNSVSKGFGYGNASHKLPRVAFPPSFGFATLQTQAHASIPETVTYTIKFYTGEIRGAGTNCEATIELVGKEGTSDVLTVTDGFARGTVKEFALRSEKSLGSLQQVVVRMKDAGITEFGQGCWFGNNEPGEEGGIFERNLLVCPTTDQSNGLRTRPLTRPLDAMISAVSFPHPDKVRQGMRAVSRKHFGQGGEDAYFYTESKDKQTVGVGVADGVYMWRVHGIDAGAYSRCLMHSAKEEVERGTRDALEVLKAAARHAKKEKVEGSSTACLVLLDKRTGVLHSATLGDSGFLVAGRTNRSKDQEMVVKYRTPQQEHSFGYPFQLGHVETLDRPVDALLAQVPLEEGDIVVVGSDGLFDNVFDQQICAEIETVLSKGRAAGQSPAALAPAIAHRLASVAFENSLNKTVSTPYSVGASEYFDMIYHGGKKDDLTVIALLCV